MRLSRLFGLLSLVAFLVISQSVLSVKAETITKDFGEVNFHSSDMSTFASMDVEATVQTETNGQLDKRQYIPSNS
ncbi:MAG: hypothetical protein M1490_02035 [Candidatus Bathyarchaeota archaeon]|nr:hypothetical protein [Candidatus Bathyarchaeota archaeon]